MDAAPGGAVQPETTDPASSAASRPERPNRQPRCRIAKTAQVIGELLVTFGVIVFLFIFYELKITDWKTADSQHRLARALQQQWSGVPTKSAGPQTSTKSASADPPPVVVDGAGFAILRIPRLGANYHWVVVEGVDRGDLEEGPGHYPGTALPGQLGNMVVSGHRTTYGHPFNRLDELRVSDVVNLQVRAHTYRYHVIKTEIVDPNDTAVILPVPGAFGAKPTRRLLTMTTCNPKYSAAQRLVVTAELTAGGG